MSEQNESALRQDIAKHMLALSDRLATMADEMDFLIKSYLELLCAGTGSGYETPANPIRQAYRGTMEWLMDVRLREAKALSRYQFNRMLAEHPESIE